MYVGRRGPRLDSNLNWKNKMLEAPLINPPAEAEEEEEKEYPIAEEEGTEDDATPPSGGTASAQEARTSDWLEEPSTRRLYSATRSDDAGADPDQTSFPA